MAGGTRPDRKRVLGGLLPGVGRASDALRYMDVVEEALCFGWIDPTCKNDGGIPLQRLSPRKKGSRWTELNKERCRRLENWG